MSGGLERASLFDSFVIDTNRSIQAILVATQTGQIDVVDTTPGVWQLCQALDGALHHRLKSPFFGSARFWTVAKHLGECLPEGEEIVRRVAGLPDIKTDLGRSRAFVRFCLNRHALSDCLNALLWNRALIANHYEADAFMRNEDRIEVFVMLLDPLRNLPFQLTVNNSELDILHKWRLDAARMVQVQLPGIDPAHAQQLQQHMQETLPPQLQQQLAARQQQQQHLQAQRAPGGDGAQASPETVLMKRASVPVRRTVVVPGGTESRRSVRVARELRASDAAGPSAAGEGAGPAPAGERRTRTRPQSYQQPARATAPPAIPRSVISSTVVVDPALADADELTVADSAADTAPGDASLALSRTSSRRSMSGAAHTQPHAHDADGGLASTPQALAGSVASGQLARDAASAAGGGSYTGGAGSVGAAAAQAASSSAGGGSTLLVGPNGIVVGSMDGYDVAHFTSLEPEQLAKRGTGRKSRKRVPRIASDAREASSMSALDQYASSESQSGGAAARRASGAWPIAGSAAPPVATVAAASPAVVGSSSSRGAGPLATSVDAGSSALAGTSVGSRRAGAGSSTSVSGVPPAPGVSPSAQSTPLLAGVPSQPPQSAGSRAALPASVSSPELTAARSVGSAGAALAVPAEEAVVAASSAAPGRARRGRRSRDAAPSDSTRERSASDAAAASPALVARDASVAAQHAAVPPREPAAALSVPSAAEGSEAADTDVTDSAETAAAAAAAAVTSLDSAQPEASAGDSSSPTRSPRSRSRTHSASEPSAAGAVAPAPATPGVSRPLMANPVALLDNLALQYASPSSAQPEPWVSVDVNQLVVEAARAEHAERSRSDTSRPASRASASADGRGAEQPADGLAGAQTESPAQATSPIVSAELHSRAVPSTDVLVSEARVDDAVEYVAEPTQRASGEQRASRQQQDEREQAQQPSLWTAEHGGAAAGSPRASSAPTIDDDAPAVAAADQPSANGVEPVPADLLVTMAVLEAQLKQMRAESPAGEVAGRGGAAGTPSAEHVASSAPGDASATEGTVPRSRAASAVSASASASESVRDAPPNAAPSLGESVAAHAASGAAASEAGASAVAAPTAAPAASAAADSASASVSTPPAPDKPARFDPLAPDLILTPYRKKSDMKSGACYQCGAALQRRGGLFRGVGNFCYYSGELYCDACHGGSTCVIPALAVFDWNLKELPVCDSAYEYIHAIEGEPLLRPFELNPGLGQQSPEMYQVHNVRVALAGLGKIVLTCPAFDPSVVDVLETRMYMLAYAGFYSLVDMIDAYSGQLLPKLTALRKQLDTHVRFECPTCRLAGEQCPACSRDDLLYAFDEDVVRCRLCLKLFHSDCYTSPSVCPSCARARQRASVARPLQPVAGPSPAPGR